jgi:hypothetical protein
MTFQEARSWRVRGGPLVLSVVLFGAMSIAVQLTNLKVPRHEQSTSVSSGQSVLLTRLADSTKPIECAEGLIPFPDRSNAGLDRRSKNTTSGPCYFQVAVHEKKIAENIDKWRFKDHSLFMHDDDAMDKLINRYWPEFPQLQQIQNGSNFGGPVKCRYLASPAPLRIRRDIHGHRQRSPQV